MLAKAKDKRLPRLQKVLADDGYSDQPMIDHVRGKQGWEFESVKQTGVCWRLKRANKIARLAALIYANQWKIAWIDTN